MIFSQQTNSRVFIAGAGGMVGGALDRKLSEMGFKDILTPGRSQLDLTNQSAVNAYFQNHKIDYVFLAAAKVGGIMANKTFPVEFLYENLMIGANIIKAAADANVKKLLFLGSSCIYPRLAPQPMHEECLLTSSLEPTNEAYAIAKITGLKLVEYYNRQMGKNFISAMPTNLYGIGDNYHPTHSHVIPGLLRRFHEAKMNKLPSVEVWGSGKVRREFLDVDELATALIRLMDVYEEATTINVGSGYDMTISEVAQTIKKTVDFQGELKFDSSKPDGTPQKLLSVDRINKLGWKSTLSFEKGLSKAYTWALQNSRF